MALRLIARIILLSLVSLALLIGLWFLGWKLEFWGTQMRRGIVKESHAYNEGKVSQLLQLYEEYLKVDTQAQKDYLILRMRIESERVGAEDTPQVVLNLIRRTR